MSDLSNIYNIRKADNSYKRHGFSKQHHLRPIKIGPEPYNSRILRGIYYMTSTTIPALKREAIDVNFIGVPLKTQGQLEFGGGETTIGFKTAGDYLGRNAIEQWMFEMGNPVTGGGTFCTGDDSTIQYALVNELGKVVRGVEFHSIFPTNVGDISYSNEEVGVTTFDVSFAYNYWLPLDISNIDLGDDPDAQNPTKIYDQYEKLIDERDTSDNPCEV